MKVLLEAKGGKKVFVRGRESGKVLLEAERVVRRLYVVER